MTTSTQTAFTLGGPALRPRPRRSERISHPRQGRPSLEDRVRGLWTDLNARGSASCPICPGELAADGVCTACGSQLS